MQRLKERIAAAEGLLIVTPSTTTHARCAQERDRLAVASSGGHSAGVSRAARRRDGGDTGQGGTALSQAAWLPVWRTLGMRPWFEGRAQIPTAGKVFDSQGRVVDEAMRERIRTFIEGFAAFTDAQRRESRTLTRAGH